MEHVKRFDSYRVFIYSQFETIDAIIQFTSQGKGVGQITFKTEGAVLGTNNVNQEGFIHLYYPISKFNDIVNTLRYEKPLAINLQTDNGIGSIFTLEYEPEGEQEAV